MLSEDKYFQTLTEDELWQRYCGFLDLSIDEFMEIQKELLMDEIDRVADSLLGRKIMGDKKPKSMEEFRCTVPLTTYEDYEPYLSQKQEDALAIKPQMWGHSSGRGGSFKWLPYTSEFLDKVTKYLLGAVILASANQKGRVNISPGIRCLLFLPPPPYASGCLFRAVTQRFSVHSILDSEKIKDMEFQERGKAGFQIALKDGVDAISALGSVLVRMGESFTEQKRVSFSPSMLHPKIVNRLLRAWLRSKREKREILPKDLWPTKVVMASGVDTKLYRGDIARYWGSEPYEFYACAESEIVAIEGWNRKGMVFPPDIVFLEFIPYEGRPEGLEDKDYQPSTVLLNELKEGKLYEVVLTHFYGMPLLRYRMKDVIQVVALRDDEAGISLPHIVLQRRIGETINLGGLAELDEKTIWQAIANTGIKYTDWAACKEYDQNQSFLRLYLELREEKQAAEVASRVNQQLKIIDIDYRDIDTYLKLQPVRVTLLSPGTFLRYMEEKRRQGADLTHLKPTHVNAPEAVIERLLQLSEVGKEK